MLRYRDEGSKFSSTTATTTLFKAFIISHGRDHESIVILSALVSIAKTVEYIGIDYWVKLEHTRERFFQPGIVKLRTFF